MENSSFSGESIDKKALRRLHFGRFMDQCACAVTGAAGFIGSHVVDRLLASGHRVVGVDNLSLGRRENLRTALGNSRFRFEVLDVNDQEGLFNILRNAGTGEPMSEVWHLAANSDIQAGVRDPEIDLKATFLTTFNTLQVMRRLRIPRLVFASTSAIYGPMPGAIAEDAGPLLPISNYGAMKLGSEGLITAALESFLERVCIFRFPNVIGSRATHGAIYDFIHKLRKTPGELEVLGDGNQVKPYLHVSELVEAMFHIVRSNRAKLERFNIAPDGSATTVRRIAETVVREMSPQARIRYTGGDRGWVGDVPKFEYSIEKIKAAGWKPRLSSDEAVELAVRENVGGEAA
jgi:UDP-glucose 4-epimerase